MQGTSRHESLLTRCRSILIACSLGVCLAATSVVAEEGRVPIFEPTTITQSGKYVVTRDISDATNTVILINGTGTETVDIDLNGFTITSGPSNIAVRANDTKSLVIRNGFLVNTGSTVSNVEVVSTGAESAAVFEDLVISGGHTALHMTPVHNLVVRNNVMNGVGRGIYIVNLLFPLRGIIEGNVMNDVGTQGIYLPSPSEGVQIRRNSISAVGNNGVVIIQNGTGLMFENNMVLNESADPLSFALKLDDCISCAVRNNRVLGVSQGGRVGIQLNYVHDSQVTDNISSGHGEDGIKLTESDRNTILRNVSNDNALSGIRVFSGSRNTIEGNASHDNGQFGIYINGSFNRVGRNSASGNAGAAACTAPGIPTCGVPDYCDEGTGTTSFLDNLIPGPPPC
ncbi:MAG: hypothetical protein GY716_04605 [bacterium]|nr:hypothetical protein [bacterium]